MQTEGAQGKVNTPDNFNLNNYLHSEKCVFGFGVVFSRVISAIKEKKNKYRGVFYESVRSVQEDAIRYCLPGGVFIFGFSKIGLRPPVGSGLVGSLAVVSNLYSEKKGQK